MLRFLDNSNMRFLVQLSEEKTFLEQKTSWTNRADKKFYASRHRMPLEKSGIYSIDIEQRPDQALALFFDSVAIQFVCDNKTDGSLIVKTSYRRQSLYRLNRADKKFNVFIQKANRSCTHDSIDLPELYNFRMLKTGKKMIAGTGDVANYKLVLFDINNECVERSLLIDSNLFVPSEGKTIMRSYK